MTLFQASSGSCSAGAPQDVPALLTKIWTAPKRASTASTSAGACAASDRSLTKSEEHTSELQSPCNLVCRLLLEKKKQCGYNRRDCKANHDSPTIIALPH